MRDANTIEVNEFGYRDDLTGEDAYRGLQQDLTEKEVVDLLNNFNDENKRLKKENEYWRSIYLLNCILLNKISILRKQGVELFNAFKNYLNNLTNKI